MTTPAFATPAPDQLAAIRLVLDQAGLPSGDLCGDRLSTFLVATDASQSLTHCAGLEVLGEVALLRSVAVAPAMRGKGQVPWGAHALSADHDGARVLREARLPILRAQCRPFSDFANVRVHLCLPCNRDLHVPVARHRWINVMSEKTYNVLVLCTGNSARSIMAEALINTMGHGRFKAYSAGSHPGGTVNPFAIEQVGATGYPVDGLRSKSWDEFASPDAPKMDFIITVCDNAAGEVCPIWPGQPMSAHWGFEDPAAFEGSDEQKRRVFEKTFKQIMNRVQLFVNLPLSVLDRNAIKREIDAIGKQV